ncbi:hypothetical protein MBH78_09065 [Oceanimonas sp. NS1]|nr:hypothetical protein [Oceanimonas sp. NS1]
MIIDWLGQRLPGLFRRAVGSPSRQWPMLLADLRQFEGNAQSLRLLHSLQELNLTLSQLAALQKYVRGAYQPRTGGRWQQKPGHFFSERPWCSKFDSIFPPPPMAAFRWPF